MNTVKNFQVWVCGLMLAAAPSAALAFRSGPPAGLTGSPVSGGSSCFPCHGDGSTGPGSLQIMDFPATYAPSTNYDLTVKIADATKLGAGFQISVEKAGAMHVGTLSIIDGTNTQLNSTNWVNHTLAGTNNSVANWNMLPNSNSASYMVRWTSPATDQGPITAYAVGNAINNNFNNGTGDNIYLTNVTANFLAPVPTVSQWGLAVIALLVLTVGTVVIRRRPVAVCHVATVCNR